jgi:hypothetical protein
MARITTSADDVLNSLPSVTTATITGRGVSFLTKPFEVSMSASSRYMPEPGWANSRSIPRLFNRAMSVVASTCSVGRSPRVINATECPAAVSRVAKPLMASRRNWIDCVAAWLLSTSSATRIGSVAGATERTSRATPSSRTTMSAGVTDATGAPFLSTTLA